MEFDVGCCSTSSLSTTRDSFIVPSSRKTSLIRRDRHSQLTFWDRSSRRRRRSKAPLNPQVISTVGTNPSSTHKGLQEFVSGRDVVTANAPLYEPTRRRVNTKLLKHLKIGARLQMDTTRDGICAKGAAAEVVKSGKLNGCSGDARMSSLLPAIIPRGPYEEPWGGGNGMYLATSAQLSTLG